MNNHSSHSLFSIGIFTIAVACITYFLLSFFSPHTHHHDIGQDVLPPQQAQIDTVENNELIQNLLQEALGETHNSASTNDESIYATLCKEYQSICDKTTFSTNSLTTRQQLYYQVIVIYILKKLSSFGVYSDYLNTVNVKSQSATLRGFVKNDQITLDIRPMQNYNEFLQVLVHELGHVLDLKQVVGTYGISKDNQFTEFGKAVFSLDDASLGFYKLSWSSENTRLSSASYEDFVSGYGMSNTFEDFAESFNFYINYNQIFQKLTLQSDILRQKYDYLDKLLGGKYINNWLKKQEQFEQYERDFRPYDTTRF